VTILNRLKTSGTGSEYHRVKPGENFAIGEEEKERFFFTSKDAILHHYLYIISGIFSVKASSVFPFYQKKED